MTTQQTLDVGGLIDGAGIGARQWLVVVLCGCVAMLDGFGVQAIGLAAPGISAQMHIPPKSFGSVFSAALAGLTIGAFLLGPLADRIGRKWVLIGSTLAFGLFSFATAQAQSFEALLAYRFLAGIGLGGAMPSFIALSSELVPRAQRASIVSLVWAGFPLGGVICGLLGARLIPSYGWHSLFWVGGLVPIALALAQVAVLPESPVWLIDSGAAPSRVGAVLQRLYPRQNFSGVRVFTHARLVQGRGRFGDLFRGGQAGGTLLLWLAYFFVFMVLVTNSAWTPLLLKAQGIPIEKTSLAMAVFNFASVFGSGSAGYLVFRFKPQIVLAVTIIGGAIAYAMVGWLAPAFTGVFWAEAACGLLIGSGSSCLIGLGAVFYPSHIRSTGVGWATAAGRFGSFSGPLIISVLVGAAVHASVIFAVLAIGACLSGIACLFLVLPKGAAAE